MWLGGAIWVSHMICMWAAAVFLSPEVLIAFSLASAQNYISELLVSQVKVYWCKFCCNSTYCSRNMDTSWCYKCQRMHEDLGGSPQRSNIWPHGCQKDSGPCNTEVYMAWNNEKCTPISQGGFFPQFFPEITPSPVAHDNSPQHKPNNLKPCSQPCSQAKAECLTETSNAQKTSAGVQEFPNVRLYRCWKLSTKDM